MDLTSELVSFTSSIFQYLLIPFDPAQHSPLTIILTTLAYPLGITLLLTNTVSTFGASVLRLLLATAEHMCIVFLMILAAPALVFSAFESRLSRKRAFTQESFKAGDERARTAREKHWQEQPSEFISELHPAFDILGLPPHASHSEIRDAYRRLMKSHHPDKFMQASPAEQERARRRTLEIRLAYEEALSSHPYIH